MDDGLISVRDIASQHGKRKQKVFKILKRLGIETTKQRSSTSRNQLIAYITQEQLKLVLGELLAIRGDKESEEDDLNGIEITIEQGVFYLIQLEPQFDPCRFKVGFAASLPERLRHLRCSAPFATVIRSWPCQRLWEKTTIDYASAGCERLHTEVFRAETLHEIVSRCDKFFALMLPVSLSQTCGRNGAAEPVAAPDLGSIT